MHLHLLKRSCAAVLMTVLATGVMAMGAAPSSTSSGQDSKAGKNTNPFAALAWQHGPTTAKLGSRATMKIPAGYSFLSPVEANKFLTLTHNLTDATHHYILAPDHANWFVDFSFDPVGYVKDHQTIDANEVLSNIRKNTKRANEEEAKRGWSAMTIKGWQLPPQYNPSTHRLEWAIRAESGGQPVVNYNTRILGRHGVMTAVLVDDPAKLSSDEATVNQLLGGFTYNANEKYAAYKSGDKVAEYGLAALITGGTVAVAAKTGLLALLIAKMAALWKLLAAGAVAVFAFIGKLFGFSKKKRNAAKEARGIATDTPEGE